jgi:hypothetical protein
LAAILLGLSGRLTMVRAAEPAAVPAEKPAGVGVGPLAAADDSAEPAAKPAKKPKKPKKAAAADEPAVGQGSDPFAPAPQVSPSAETPPAASRAGKPADAPDPWGNFDSAPGEVPPKTARKARPQTIEPSPQHSNRASMKITIGKASGRSTAAELAASEEIIEKSLLRPVTIDVLKTPLNEFAEQLARQLDVNVLLDQKALSDAGVDPTTPVTCKVTNLPLRSALGELLRPLQLTWVIHNGILLVTTPDEAEKLLTTRVYDVSSLLFNPPDYPAGRSGDLGDTDPLFAPPPERNDLGGIMANGLGGAGTGAGGARSGVGMGGTGMGGMFNVGNQPDSPPILRQAAARTANNRARPRRQGPSGDIIASGFDDLIDSITSTIQPTVWDDVGGPCSIAPFAPQQLLIVRATGDVHDQLTAFLNTLRHHVEIRPQIRIEAHWLWLTEPELASLLGNQDQASHSAGDVVDEAAWKKLRQQKRDDGDDAAGAFEAILKGLNGQLISGVSGRQTRVLITLIPVVGDPPAAGSGMGGMGPAPELPQTPAVPAPTALPPSPVGTYPIRSSSVGYEPVCRTIQEGGALEVRPCVVAEGKEILLDLRSRFVQREDSPDAKPQTPPAGVAAGANNGVAAGTNRDAASSSANVVRAIAAAVDRPQIHHYRLETTLRVPAGRRVLAGGLTYGDPSADESNLYLFVKATVVSGQTQTDH